jgi:hypothetical protein
MTMNNIESSETTAWDWMQDVRGLDAELLARYGS